MTRSKITDKEAKEAVAALIQWIGDDPSREGLKKSPEKITDMLAQLFSGYAQDPAEILNTPLYNADNNNDMILLKGISFLSFCEHHMLPFTGSVNIAYIPNNGVMGFDRISQLVDAFSRRLQLQERLTNQIAETLFTNLKCSGVAVSISGIHQCMNIIGAKKEKVVVYTEKMLGSFENNSDLQNHFALLTTNQQEKNEI